MLAKPCLGARIAMRQDRLALSLLCTIDSRRQRDTYHLSAAASNNFCFEFGGPLLGFSFCRESGAIAHPMLFYFCAPPSATLSEVSHATSYPSLRDRIENNAEKFWNLWLYVYPVPALKAL